jgi:hypothetical protein
MAKPMRADGVYDATLAITLRIRYAHAVTYLKTHQLSI